jgi:SpoVK/Ycf46/Vps4 family AAA+-type ATPase
MSNLKRGTEVLIIGCNEGRVIAGVREPSFSEGRLSKIQRVLDDGRVLIEDGGHGLILSMAEGLGEFKSGDEIRYDLDSLMVLEVISSENSSVFALSDKPDFTFDDIKGLDEEKKFLRERIVYPAVYKEKFKKYGLKAIRGALLHGPPGNGKTMLAGAIFNEIATLKKTNDFSGFFLINGPEVLNKWAGNTEEAIRNIFEQARLANKKSGIPSVICWDEIESITGKRKDSSTYTPEKTVVPTLLAQMQGVINGGDVILIGLTNRPDLIDPALMRPGRMGDAILEIPRPDNEAGAAILDKVFQREELPAGLKCIIDQGLRNKLIEHTYDNENPLAFAKLQSGETSPLMRQEMVNGALFAQIGEELVLKACMAEIYGSDPPTIPEAIEMLDNILLNQLGVLDAGAKNGFTFNTSDYVIDVSLNS